MNEKEFCFSLLTVLPSYYTAAKFSEFFRTAFEFLPENWNFFIIIYCNLY